VEKSLRINKALTS